MSRIPPKSEYPWWIRKLFKQQRTKYGKVLESTKIWARIPRLFFGLATFFGAFERRGALIEEELRGLLLVHVSMINRCNYCIDLNSMMYLKRGKNEEKLKELVSFSKSPVFTEKERVALEYASAMTYTDREVDDALFARLKEHFSEDAIVEMTGLIAFQNCSTKFNSALKI